MNIFKKIHGEKTDNSLLKIYANKIENKITFQFKWLCYLKLLTPKTIKLLEDTKNKITKNENGENISHLEITEVVLVLCDIITNDYGHDSRVHLFLINHLVNY